MLQLELIKILDGLRSRWIIKPECKYLSAFVNWYIINFICIYFNIPYAITLCKSAYIYSNIRYTSLLLSAFIDSYNFIMFEC